MDEKTRWTIYDIIHHAISGLRNGPVKYDIHRKMSSI